MPVYVYRREDGTEFEKHQRMNDDKLEVCPDTGQPVKRIIQAATSIIKGWSPDKELKKKQSLEKNPYQTTLPEYQKKIDENTQKAIENENKLRDNG
jgi:putative FmdB family regulatory protein